MVTRHDNFRDEMISALTEGIEAIIVRSKIIGAHPDLIPAEIAHFVVEGSLMGKQKPQESRT